MAKKRLRFSPETSSIEQLPDDVLIHILSSLTSFAAMARTSILSRRWRNLWLNTTCLDFDPTTVIPTGQWSEQSQAGYISWVDKVIETRVASPELPSVKKLRIWYDLDAIQGHHIEWWIKFAVSNPLETLHLQFISPYPLGNLPHHQYKLSIESWYNAPCGLSNLRCLKSLHLWYVNVSEQFIESIFSSCPLLEDLSLIFARTVTDLDVSGVPPLRLRRLKIRFYHDCVLTKLCAPYLTSLCLYVDIFNPHKIDVPMLTDLSIDGRRHHVFYYLERFRSYLPQLEKLELLSLDLEFCLFKLEQIPEMVKLKYLKISFNEDTNYIYDDIINLINACPRLETLAFETINGEVLRRLRPYKKRKIWRKVAKKDWCFKCLKALEVYGGNGKTINQEVVKIIISKAPNLEKLTVAEDYVSRLFPYTTPSTPRMAKKLERKARALCEGRLVEINVK